MRKTFKKRIKKINTIEGEVKEKETNKTPCEKWCSDGCFPGCKGTECLGCIYNPEDLY